MGAQQEKQAIRHHDVHHSHRSKKGVSIKVGPGGEHSLNPARPQTVPLTAPVRRKHIVHSNIASPSLVSYQLQRGRRSIGGSPRLSPRVAHVHGEHEDTPHKSPVYNFDEEEKFTQLEADILRKTFGKMKDNREKMASEMLKRVSTVDGAIDIFERGNHSVGNAWSDVNLGIVLMSGIERCLLRVHDHKMLVETVMSMKKRHKNYRVPAEMMLIALLKSQQAVLVELEHYHEHGTTNIHSRTPSFKNGTGGKNAPTGALVHQSSTDSNLRVSGSPVNHQEAWGGGNNNRSCCPVCMTWVKFFHVVCNIFAVGLRSAD